MSDPKDLVTRRAYVRVYSQAHGPTDHVLAEGTVIWYQQAPTIGLRHSDGSQSAWSVHLRREEIDTPHEALPKHAIGEGRDDAPPLCWALLPGDLVCTAPAGHPPFVPS